MEPLIAKPGEIIKGLGFDFATRLTTGETVSSVTVTPSASLTVGDQSYSGTLATATITVPDDAQDSDETILFRVIGSAGTTRKATRIIWIRSASE